MGVLLHEVNATWNSIVRNSSLEFASGVFLTLRVKRIEPKDTFNLAEENCFLSGKVALDTDSNTNVGRENPPAYLELIKELYKKWIR